MNGEHSEIHDNVGTLVSSSIENAIKRMDAVDEEMASCPGNEDNSDMPLAPNCENSPKAQ